MDHARIVSLGGAVTDTLFRLGAGKRIVARDATSVKPAAEVASIPKLGLFRAVAAEGILATKPTLVVAIKGSGPASALRQLQHAGVDVVMVDDAPTVQAATARLNALGKLIGVQKKGQQLATSLQKQVETTRSALEGAVKPKVMFVYARGRKTLLVSGTDTPAAAMVELAGGANAMTQYNGFRPLTAEGVIAAAPEVIVATHSGLASLGGVDGFLQLPGVAETPAGRTTRIVALDDLDLLGFGASMGSALAELARALHPAKFGGAAL